MISFRLINAIRLLFLMPFLLSDIIYAQLDLCITEQNRRCEGGQSDPGNDPYDGDYTGRDPEAGGPLSPGEGGPGGTLGRLSESFKEVFQSFDGKYRNKQERDAEKRRQIAAIQKHVDRVQAAGNLISENVREANDYFSSNHNYNFSELDYPPAFEWPDYEFPDITGSYQVPDFKTSMISHDGEALRDAYDRAYQAQVQARNLGVNYPESYSSISREAIKTADNAFYSGDSIRGHQYLTISNELVNHGLYSTAYFGSGKDWYEAVHGHDVYGNRLDTMGYSLAVVGVAQRVAVKRGFEHIGGAATRTVPRLSVIQGGAASGAATLAPSAVRLLRVANKVGLIMVGLNETIMSDQIGPHLALEDSVIEPFAINDSRITMPSPPLSADPSEWMEYLTGTGRYSGQIGVIGNENREIAEALLEAGYRNPRQIEGIINSGGQLTPQIPLPGREDRLALFDEPKERAIAEYLEDLGRKVEKNPLEGVVGAGRQPDAIVDGVPHEFKSLVPGATSSTVKNALNRGIKGEGQARNFVIDARGSGLSKEEARKGIFRALGTNSGKVDYIVIIGDDYFIGYGSR